MANLSPSDFRGFAVVAKKIEALIEEAEGVLLQSCQDAPSPSEFQKNNEITKQWILETQVVLTNVANTQTRLSIEDRRLWAFGEHLKREYGVMESEELTKRVHFYIKSMRDVRDMLREKKDDLIHVITSVRSVQSAVTSRFKHTNGG